MRALLNPLLTLLAALALPGLILVLALWLEDATLRLAAAQLSLLAGLPALILAVGIGVALRFNRVRVLAALASLLLGYAALAWLGPALQPFEQRTLLALLLLLLPLNHLACHVLPDHAAVAGLRLPLAAVLGAEILLFALLAATGWEWATDALLANVFGFANPPETSLSDAGFVAAVILLTLSFARLYALPSTQRAALFASGYCLVLMLANADQPASLVAFATAAALILAVAAFQESWNIAYLDTLTELPGRRALDEALARLEGDYAVAMLDVDHFKQFNDTHGHDVGDQVLRMVAFRLREVGGGGKAYRYGGEEFTILFPGSDAATAMPLVDALRAAIAADHFEIRRHDRRGTDTEPDFDKPPATIRITVSGGVAARRDREQPPADVIKAADDALYRAKREGRNCVRDGM